MQTPPPRDPSSKPRPRRVSALRWIVGIIVLMPLATISIGFWRGCLRNFEVVSRSMAPTLEVGDRVLVRSVTDTADLHGRPVAFNDPKNPGEIVATIIGAARAALDEYEHIIKTNKTIAPPQVPGSGQPAQVPHPIAPRRLGPAGRRCRWHRGLPWPRWSAASSTFHPRRDAVRRSARQDSAASMLRRASRAVPRCTPQSEGQRWVAR